MADPTAADGTHDAQEARAKLMSAAAELFSRQARVSVREIAEAAGVNHGLVHYYFGSKENLRKQALAHIIEEAAGELPVDDSLSPRELVDRVWRVYSGQVPALRMGLRAMLDRDFSVLEGSSFAITRRLESVVAPDSPALSSLTVSAFLASLVGHLVFRPWFERSYALYGDAVDELARAEHAKLVARARDGRAPVGAPKDRQRACPRPPPAEPDKRAQARHLLMEAAATLFADKSKVSVREIAEAAGVNHGLVHYYFGSKEQLHRDAFDHVGAHEAMIRSLDEDPSPAGIVDTLLSLWMGEPRVIRLAVRDVLEPRTTLMEERRFATLAKVAEVAVPGRPDESARIASFVAGTLVATLALKDWMAATGVDEGALIDFSRRWMIDVLREARA